MFFAAGLLVTAAACGAGGPSVKEVEELLRPLVEEGQADRVDLVEFSKVSDQLEEIGGVPTYLINYVAKTQFEQDSLVEFSSERPYVRAYPLEPARPACATLGKSPTDSNGAPIGAVWNCIRVNKGDRLRSEGTFRFEKSDKGWTPVRAQWLDPNKMTLEPAK
jgi:hypothetical protein